MAYATVDELAAVMTLENPTADQVESMQRALDAAAEEIDWFLGYITGPPDPVPALVVQVNLDRAHEHFDQAQSPFGMMTIGDEGAASISSSWRRHANKLLSLRLRHGVA